MWLVNLAFLQSGPLTPFSGFCLFSVLVGLPVVLICHVSQRNRKRRADQEKREWNLRLCELSDRESALRSEAAAKRTAGDPSWSALQAEADRLHKEQDRMLFPNLK